MKTFLFFISIAFLIGCNDNSPTCCIELIHPPSQAPDGDPWDLEHSFKIDTITNDVIYKFKFDAPSDCVNRHDDFDSANFHISMYFYGGDLVNNLFCLMDENANLIDFEFDLRVGDSTEFIFNNGLFHPHHLNDYQWIWNNSACEEIGGTDIIMQLTQTDNCYYSESSFTRVTNEHPCGWPYQGNLRNWLRYGKIVDHYSCKTSKNKSETIKAIFDFIENGENDMLHNQAIIDAWK